MISSLMQIMIVHIGLVILPLEWLEKVELETMVEIYKVKEPIWLY